jgi:hypothetical protein
MKYDGKECIHEETENPLPRCESSEMFYHVHDVLNHVLSHSIDETGLLENAVSSLELSLCNLAHGPNR